MERMQLPCWHCQGGEGLGSTCGAFLTFSQGCDSNPHGLYPTLGIASLSLGMVWLCTDQVLLWRQGCSHWCRFAVSAAMAGQVLLQVLSVWAAATPLVSAAMPLQSAPSETRLEMATGRCQGALTLGLSSEVTVLVVKWSETPDDSEM